MITGFCDLLEWIHSERQDPTSGGLASVGQSALSGMGWGWDVDTKKPLSVRWGTSLNSSTHLFVIIVVVVVVISITEISRDAYFM